MKLLRIAFCLIVCIAVLAVGVVSTLAATPCPKDCKSCPMQSTQCKTNHVAASYFTDGELFYVSISLSDNKLTAVYLPTTWRGSTTVVTQQAQYKPRDLKHAEAKLSKAEVKEFAQLVKSSGFLKLRNRYDDTKGHRPYETRITAELNGKTKAVEYLSSETPAPKAFTQVGEWLLKTAKAKFKAFP